MTSGGTTTGDDATKVFVFVVLAPLLGLGVPLALTSATAGNSDLPWVWAFVISAVVGVRLATLIASGRRHLVDFTVTLFIYAFLGLAPLVQMRSGVWPGTTPNPPVTQFGAALAAATLFYAAYIVGSYIQRKRRITDAPPASPTVMEASGFSLRTTLFALGALLVGLYYIQKVGPSTLTNSRQGLDIRVAQLWPNQTTRAIFVALATMSLLVAFVALVRQRRLAARKQGGPLIAVVLAMLLLAVNPITSPRYVAGTVLLALAAVLGGYATRQRFRLVAAGIVAGLLLIFPLADAFRYTDTAEAKVSGPVQALSSADFDAFIQLANSLDYIDVNGTTYGRQALGVALFWVPRSVWANKPVDTGILLAEQRGYTFTNLSAPLPAELLINGGWAVLLLGGLLLGIVARRADERIELELQRAKAPGILGCILPGYLLIVLRGSLLQSMAYLTVIAACAWWVRRPSRAATSSTHESTPRATVLGRQT